MLHKKVLFIKKTLAGSIVIFLFFLQTSVFVDAQENVPTEKIATSTEPTIEEIAAKEAEEARVLKENSISQIRSQIVSRNQEIADLEKEIRQYQEQIQKTSTERKTLNNELKTLDLTRKKLTADISVTNKKIETTNLTIQSLTKNISQKQSSIVVQQDGIRNTIKKAKEIDDISLLEALLKNQSLSTFWNNRIELAKLHESMSARVQTLLAIKEDLTKTRTTTETEQKKLTKLKNQLGDQKSIVEFNKKQTDQILKETKNKESEYKKVLAEREAKRLAVEQEIDEYESQLQLLIDPTSYPTPSKVLRPPLDILYVTQHFGQTDFARQNSSIYSGRGHNGADFRASPGTPVKAAFAGIVQGQGNTDTVCPGASYGKWVLIKHGNGLSTIYAHLSLIKAIEGEQVETGDLIGYSGNTGYSTGPHLHFGLFASQGIQITNLKSKVCRGTYRVPVADVRAYLNPMLYL
ncbi:MAG: peptidoglycan DD-metalloendopeptidase family protein [Patescibacteria group bacterium]